MEHFSGSVVDGALWPLIATGGGSAVLRLREGVELARL